MCGSQIQSGSSLRTAEHCIHICKTLLPLNKASIHDVPPPANRYCDNPVPDPNTCHPECEGNSLSTPYHLSSQLSSLRSLTSHVNLSSLLSFLSFQSPHPTLVIPISLPSPLLPPLSSIYSFMSSLICSLPAPQEGSGHGMVTGGGTVVARQAWRDSRKSSLLEQHQQRSSLLAQELGEKYCGRRTTCPSRQSATVRSRRGAVVVGQATLGLLHDVLTA